MGSLKRVIKKGMKDSLLQMTSDLNNLVRSDYSATPTKLIAGRAVQTNMPGSGRREVDLAEICQKRILTQEALMKKLRRGRFSEATYELGDNVRIQCPKEKTWGQTGVISELRTHEGGMIPKSYVITTEDGQSFLRNGKFVRLHQETAETGSVADEGVKRAGGESRLAAQLRPRHRKGQRVTFEGSEQSE